MTSTERDEEAAAADAAHYGLVRVTKMSFSDKERYRTEYKRMVPHSLFFDSVAEHHLPPGDYNRIRIGGP